MHVRHFIVQLLSFVACSVPTLRASGDAPRPCPRGGPAGPGGPSAPCSSLSLTARHQCTIPVLMGCCPWLRGPNYRRHDQQHSCRTSPQMATPSCPHLPNVPTSRLLGKCAPFILSLSAVLDHCPGIVLEALRNRSRSQGWSCCAFQQGTPCDPWRVLAQRPTKEVGLAVVDLV